MEIEPDQRHVDILLREHGLDDSRSKGVDTPRVKKSESQVFAGLESPPLDREGVSVDWFPDGSRILQMVELEQMSACLTQAST